MMVEVMHPASPWRGAIAYPHGDAEAIAPQLQRLGITRLYSYGEQRIGAVQVIGLGYCGVVILGDWQGQRVAVKIRRSDASRASLDEEAAHLTVANRVGIGPRLWAASADCLVMEYLDGPSLPAWIREHPGAIAPLLQNLLHQAHRLDQQGLDHGNLRCVTEHVRVQGAQPVLLDFSSASTHRRPANLTTLTQGLFWGTAIANTIALAHPLPERDRLIPLLRRYKHDPTPAHAAAIIEAAIASP
jgi:predicted Ser/Thr protein kinase